MTSLNSSKVLIGVSSFSAMDKTPMKRLLSAGCKVIENPYKRRLTREELLNLLEDNVEGLIAGLEPLDREVLKQSSLKVISRVGSGISNIDMEAARELGIKVCSTPHGPTEAVAELTIGAMLSLLRMIPQMNSALHNDKWEKRIGSQLKGKTIVIIGFGKIGQRVASLLSSFKTQIIAVDPHVQSANNKIRLISLEDALPQADIITIHSSGEECMLAAREFDLMKKGVFLLNASRGGLIDEEALLKAIDSGKMAGAWLDTFTEEPYTGPLAAQDNIILTPHVGSYTKECRYRMEMEAVENLIKGLRLRD